MVRLTVIDSSRSQAI